MIELHQFRPFWGLPNASPFCMKAETYLRYRGLPFRTVPSGPRRSPTGQIPFIVEDGQVVADSGAIIEHFEARQREPMDTSLDASQRAAAFFIRELMEDHLYWQITYMRWGDPAGWAVFKPDLVTYLPLFMRGPLLFAIRRKLLRRMRQRGLSPANPESAYDRGKQVLDALAAFLANQSYFLGERPRTLDMSVYAFLANIVDQPYSNPLQAHARRHGNLVAYCQRMRALCFPEYPPYRKVPDTPATGLRGSEATG